MPVRVPLLVIMALQASLFAARRLELCRQHGIQMMVDLQAPENHVYKCPEKAEAVCMKLRANADVGGYSIWNDPIGKLALRPAGGELLRFGE